MSNEGVDEWLVTDHYGHFALGTASGLRTRHLHCFLSAIEGRASSAPLSHVELFIDGTALWKSPHQFRFELWPVWSWETNGGRLSVEYFPSGPGCFSLQFYWLGPAQIKPTIILRPQWAGPVEFRVEDWGIHFKSLESESESWVTMSEAFDWQAPEEIGKSNEELSETSAGDTLYCAGQLAFSLTSAERLTVLFSTSVEKNRLAAESLSTLSLNRKPQLALPSARARALLDFVMIEPPGVAASFPSQSENSMDTFLSISGIVAVLFESEPRIRSWAIEVLERWSRWLEPRGAVPSHIEGNKPLFETANSTLWWIHALAGLWSMSLAKPALGLLELLPRRFGELLGKAVKTISEGKHPFLRSRDDGLLEADNIGASAAAINALWVQARCLHSIWRRKNPDLQCLELARKAIESASAGGEPEKVLLHSLPLAPSFIAGCASFDEPDAAIRIKSCALLSAPNLGQPTRGWLLGQHELATDRCRRFGVNVAGTIDTGQRLSPVDGHVAEYFWNGSGSEGLRTEGAPAHSASLACLEEAQMRRRWAVDDIACKIVESHFRRKER